MKVYDTFSLSLSFVFIVATAKSVEISGSKKFASTASMLTSVASLSENNSLDSTRGIETTKFTTDSPATNSKKKTTTQYHHNVKDLNVSSNHGKATTTAADTHGTSFKNLNQKRHNSPRPAPLNAKLDSGIIGSLLIGLLAVIIIIVLFVVLMCMMHRWRTNMIQSASHPSVVYSMLRQNENDPEDQLGEILVSIGLASECDIIREPSHSESSDSPSPIPSNDILDPDDDSLAMSPTSPLKLDDPAFFYPLVLGDKETRASDPYNEEALSTVPLKTNRATKEETDDEELLQ